MKAEADDTMPTGVAHDLLVRQSRLIGWQIASERAGFALKVLTGAAPLLFPQLVSSSDTLPIPIPSLVGRRIASEALRITHL